MRQGVRCCRGAACSIERTRLQAWHSMLVGARVICSRLRLHSDRGLFLRQTRTRSIDERDGRRSEEKSYREWTRSRTLRTLSLSKGPVTSRNCELEFNTAKSSVGVTRLLYSEIDRRRNDKQGIYTIRGELISVCEERRNTA